MKYLKYYLLIVIAAAFFVSCDKNDDGDNTTVSGDNLRTLIANDPELSIFNAAIERAKLGYFLDGVGPFTIFAPNNAAFNASGITSAADLNNIDTILLTQLLTYHFQQGLRTSFEIPRGPNANMGTQAGLQFFGTNSSAGIFINGARITRKDVRASNGIIHVIDAVLTPPFANALNTLAANPNHRLFVQAINKVAQTTTFTTHLITVFAPTNAAMVAGGYDSTTIANLTTTGVTTLRNIVRYHADTGRIFSSEFRNGTIKTLQGTNHTLQVDATTGAAKIKGTNNPGFFNIIARNMAVTNGIIHVIDGMLKP
jgi:uncharacterized surface protein with fasciclin (FAS1) repeats